MPEHMSKVNIHLNQPHHKYTQVSLFPALADGISICPLAYTRRLRSHSQLLLHRSPYQTKSSMIYFLIYFHLTYTPASLLTRAIKSLLYVRSYPFNDDDNKPLEGAYYMPISVPSALLLLTHLITKTSPQTRYSDYLPFPDEVTEVQTD